MVHRRGRLAVHHGKSPAARRNRRLRGHDYGDPAVGATTFGGAAVSGGQIDLTWTDTASNEAGFRLERSTDPGFATINQTFVLPANTTAYSDTGLVPARPTTTGSARSTAPVIRRLSRPASPRQ